MIHDPKISYVLISYLLSHGQKSDSRQKDPPLNWLTAAGRAEKQTKATESNEDTWSRCRQQLNGRRRKVNSKQPRSRKNNKTAQDWDMVTTIHIFDFLCVLCCTLCSILITFFIFIKPAALLIHPSVLWLIQVWVVVTDAAQGKWDEGMPTHVPQLPYSRAQGTYRSGGTSQTVLSTMNQEIMLFDHFFQNA